MCGEFGMKGEESVENKWRPTEIPKEWTEDAWIAKHIMGWHLGPYPDRLLIDKECTETVWLDVDGVMQATVLGHDCPFRTGCGWSFHRDEGAAWAIVDKFMLCAPFSLERDWEGTWYASFEPSGASFGELTVSAETRPSVICKAARKAYEFVFA